MNAHGSELQALNRLAWKVQNRKSTTTRTESAAAIEQLTEVLCELRDLLHEYAPAWYSQEQHGRVESAIQRLSKR